MDVIYKRCCGLDIHKKSITACIITPNDREIRTFTTMTEEILSLVDWIKEKRCTHVAMESTGVYWKPIYNVLEAEEIKVLVVNAKHIKTVPGRKTDVKDAEWIAELLQHGLLTGSYIPDRKQRELRELVRYRRSLIDERAREINRIQKVLEGANIKLSAVVSNINGKSSRLMLKGLIKGDYNPEDLAKLAMGRMKSKKKELTQALQGFMGHHQRMMLTTQLQHIDFLDEQISKLDAEVRERMRPFDREIDLLDTIPGVNRRAAEQILAEIGTDMSRFPSAKHLTSWAGMAPGNNESAGKRKSGKTTKGNKKLQNALIEAARAAARTKNTYLSSLYHNIAARRGKNRAAVAVGRTILESIYYMLTRNQPYIELGPDYLLQQKKDAVVKRSIKKLQSLGYVVNLEKRDEVA
jgi:transposase